MLQFLTSPFGAVVDATVHVVACFVARVLRHPAVREVLESILLSIHHDQPHHLDYLTPISSEQLEQHTHQELQQERCGVVQQNAIHVATHNNVTRDPYLPDLESSDSGIAIVIEDGKDQSILPTQDTLLAQQQHQTMAVPNASDAVVVSPIVESSTTPPELTAETTTTTSAPSHDGKEPTFFYKEIVSLDTRHIIIVVEAPILNADPAKSSGDDETTTLNEQLAVLNLSITNKNDGDMVYTTPLKEDVVMMEDLQDYADPDAYLWSITRRAAHRAAGGSIN